MAGYETVTDCGPDLYGSWPGIHEQMYQLQVEGDLSVPRPRQPCKQSRRICVNHEPSLAEVTELQGSQWLDWMWIGQM
jgi:hypothetical protein